MEHSKIRKNQHQMDSELTLLIQNWYHRHRTSQKIAIVDEEDDRR